MRVLLTLLILLFFEVFAQVPPPDFSDYGYIPRWQPDLPASLNGTVYYKYGTNVALLSDAAHPKTTAHFIFEKALLSDTSFPLHIVLRRLKTDSPCDVTIQQKKTLLGSQTCSTVFRWEKTPPGADFGEVFADIKETFYTGALYLNPVGSHLPKCMPTPYYYNDTHSIYGVQFEIMDSCPVELILPGQFMLFLPNSDNPYTTTEAPTTVEAESEPETTTVAIAKAGGGISPLIWVVIALALLALLLLLITLFLIYDHFRSKKRIKRLSNMITNMNKSNWSTGETIGPVKTLDASVTVATAVEKSKDKKLKKASTATTATTKTTGSKTAAEDTTEQTSADPSVATKKEGTYNTLTQPSEKLDRQDPTFKEKDIQTKKLDNLVPAPMDTPTERQKEKTSKPWEMLSNFSKKISKKQAPPKTQPVANTQKTDPPAKTDKSTPAIKKSPAPVAKTPNPTLKTAMTAPPTIFYSTRSKL